MADVERSTLSYVFLVGFPRSGTTMLAAALGRHDAVVATPETLFFHQLAAKIDSMLARGVGAAEVARACASDVRFRDLGFTSQALTALFVDKRPRSAPDVLRCVLAEYARRNESQVVVEKSPIHLLYLNTIADRFPGATFVMLLRDGRECVSSLLNVPWAHRSAARHSAEWCYRMRIFRAARPRLGSRVFTTRYEDIISDPERELTALSKFLGIAYQPEMCKGSLEEGSQVVPEWEREWKAKAAYGISKSHTERWQDRVSRRQAAIMNRIMGPELQRCGYDQGPSREATLLATIAANTVYSPLLYRAYRGLWAIGARARTRTGL